MFRSIIGEIVVNKFSRKLDRFSIYEARCTHCTMDARANCIFQRYVNLCYIKHTYTYIGIVVVAVAIVSL